jgi:hypothetical protein
MDLSDSQGRAVDMEHEGGTFKVNRARAVFILNQPLAGNLAKRPILPNKYSDCRIRTHLRCLSSELAPPENPSSLGNVSAYP